MDQKLRTVFYLQNRVEILRLMKFSNSENNAGERTINASTIKIKTEAIAKFL